MKKEGGKSSFKCFYCGAPIKFDPAIRSKNDRPIPLNPDGVNHDCPESPFNKGKASKGKQQQRPTERPEATTTTAPEPQPMTTETTTTTTPTLTPKVSETE